MNIFYKGIFILVIAAFFGECVEFFINMILARELHEKGMGLYMAILPIVFLVHILSSLELQISLSKYVAENKSKLHYNMLQHALTLTAYIIPVMIFLIFIGSSYTSILDNYHPFVKWLLLASIPIAALSSIARGYFMGIQHMGKIAVSGFLKKGLQFVMLFLIFHFLDFTEEKALLISLIILIGSEFFVFLYLIGLFIIHMHGMKKGPNTKITRKYARQQLMAVSIPTVGLRIFHAITNAIQPFLIHSALMASGFSAVMATEHFGMLMGVAMSIGFFPAFIAHSFMIMLIPNVSDGYAKQHFGNLRNLLHQSMSLTMLYGLPAVLIMYLFAEPLTALFFSSESAAIYLQMLWPYFLFYFFVIPMQAFLIGLGLVKEAFYHTAWSHVVSFTVMYFLGSLTMFNMSGIIIGMNAGAVLLAAMHYMAICKKIGITLWPTKQRHKPI